MSLKGKIAVVTGGSTGIGRAICQQLARDGAAIAIWDVNVSGAQDTARIIAEAGGRAMVCETDVSSSAGIAAALVATQRDFGPVTILVNNAALTGTVRFEDLSEELWNRMIAVDLTGPFLCCKAILPGMVAAGWGRIVNITSSSVQMGSPCMAHYVSAKGGLFGLTRALALEYAARGITVNNIPPGYIDTPTLRRNQSEFPTEHGHQHASVEQAVSRFPMKRAGRPEDIAAACSYLVSEAANYVTGQTLGVNGGRFLT